MIARQHGQVDGFTRYFYTPQLLRTLADFETDIRAIEAKTEGLLKATLVEPAVVLTWGRS